MFAVRIHGRGGQGVVTAAEMLSVAAFDGGRHAQAFPTFGSERMGAPVVAFCRVDDRPLRAHDPVSEPDAVVVQDPTLLHQLDILAGLRDGGFVLVNTSRSLEQLGLGETVDRLPAGHVVTVPATEIARRELGRPLPNTALLGGLAALTGVVSLDSLVTAIEERFRAETARGNVACAREAHRQVSAGRETGPTAPDQPAAEEDSIHA